MVAVSLWAELVPLADNQKTVEVEARDIRELLRKLAERYPGLRGPIKNEVAVVIDGVIYRDDWSIKLAADAEVFIMRRIAGG
jgi:molybdopterin converting factor small subunit